MSTTFTYEQVRSYEHGTVGGAEKRRSRDPDAFTAGVQYALDHVLKDIRFNGRVSVSWLEDRAADILTAAREGGLDVGEAGSQ